MSELDEETTEAIKQTVQTAILEGFEELSNSLVDTPKEPREAGHTDVEELRTEIQALRAEIDELSYTTDYKHIRGYQ